MDSGKCFLIILLQDLAYNVHDVNYRLTLNCDRAACLKARPKGRIFPPISIPSEAIDVTAFAATRKDLWMRTKKCLESFSSKTLILSRVISTLFRKCTFTYSSR